MQELLDQFRYHFVTGTMIEIFENDQMIGPTVAAGLRQTEVVHLGIADGMNKGLSVGYRALSIPELGDGRTFAPHFYDAFERIKDNEKN
jgi:hypothetical protein